jgi:hypothetical protein
MTYCDFARIEEVMMHNAYFMFINILLAMIISNIKTLECNVFDHSPVQKVLKITGKYNVTE